MQGGGWFGWEGETVRKREEVLGVSHPALHTYLTPTRTHTSHTPLPQLPHTHSYTHTLLNTHTPHPHTHTLLNTHTSPLHTRTQPHTLLHSHLTPTHTQGGGNSAISTLSTAWSPAGDFVCLEVWTVLPQRRPA